MKKQPEKTAQTKQSLINAFWDIAKRRGIKQVTISEITKKANLNRGTFYVYFTDLDDLLYQAEEKIIFDIQSKMQIVLSDENGIDFQKIAKHAAETIGAYDDMFFLLLGKDGDIRFVDRIKKEFSQLLSQTINNEKISPYQDYLLAYIISAFIGLLQFWYETEKSIPLQELAEFAYGIVLNGVAETLNK